MRHQHCRSHFYPDFYYEYLLSLFSRDTLAPDDFVFLSFSSFISFFNLCRNFGRVVVAFTLSLRLAEGGGRGGGGEEREGGGEREYGKGRGGGGETRG